MSASKLPQQITSAYTIPTSLQKMWSIGEGDVIAICKSLSSKSLGGLVTNAFVDANKFVTYFKIFPFSLTKLTESIETPITIANTTLDAECKGHALSQTIGYLKYVITVSNAVNFLSYEPFTTYQMYVPFVGFVDLDARRILGKTLTLNYVVDFHTGETVVYICTATEMLWTGTCNLGVDIPWGSDNETMNKLSFILSAGRTGLSVGSALAGKTTQDKTVTTTKSGGTTTQKNYQFKNPVGRPKKDGSKKPVKVQTSEMSVKRGDETTTTTYPGTTTPPDYASAANDILSMSWDKTTFVGGNSGSSMAAFTQPLQPYLVTTQTHIHDIPNYGKYYGYACVEEDYLGRHAGYCEVSHIHMDDIPNATVDELDAIETFLKAGVILPDITPMSISVKDQQGRAVSFSPAFAPTTHSYISTVDNTVNQLRFNINTTIRTAVNIIYNGTVVQSFDYDSPKEKTTNLITIAYGTMNTFRIQIAVEGLETIEYQFSFLSTG